MECMNVEEKYKVVIIVYSKMSSIDQIIDAVGGLSCGSVVDLSDGSHGAQIYVDDIAKLTSSQRARIRTIDELVASNLWPTVPDPK